MYWPLEASIFIDNNTLFIVYQYIYSEIQSISKRIIEAKSNYQKQQNEYIRL